VLLLLLLLLTGCHPVTENTSDSQGSLLVDDATGMRLDDHGYPAKLTGLKGLDAFVVRTDDCVHMARVLEVQRSHRQASWTNVSADMHYEMTPKDIFFSAGDLCRSFKLRVRQAHTQKDIEANACRLADASWQVQ